MNEINKKFYKLINQAKHIIIIQPENPDIDSLGSALALENLLLDLGKKVSLHCPINIPNYMRYVEGWDRVTDDFDYHADLAIIVDTASQVLLSKTLSDPVNKNFLNTKPVIIIDHHKTDLDLNFEPALAITEPAVATAETIFNIAKAIKLTINKDTAIKLMAALLGDTLGLSTPNVTAKTYQLAAELTDLGAHVYEIDQARLQLSKKSPEILKFKGELLQRVNFELDGRLATVLINFDEIQTYSDKYNPSVLVLDEMRFATDVEVAIAIKTYPDGKLTGKIRSNAPVAETIAGYFGGGGHLHAAGFRVYESYQNIYPELLDITRKALDDTTS